MKITSSKIDEIKKARDEYDADYEKRHAQYEEQRINYRKAELAVFEPIKNYVMKMIDSPILDFDVSVDTHGWKYRSIEVRVRCNESRKFEDTTALAWDFRVNLDDNGSVEKQTGSWSGLKATTPDQIASLKASVEAIETLNAIDWATVLNKTLPNYQDYITVSDYRGDRPNFEQQLKEAELEEYVGSGIPIQGRGLENLGYRYGVKGVWYLIIGETPKQYKVADFMDYYFDNWMKSAKSEYDPVDRTVENFIKKEERYAQRVKKETLIGALDYPFVEWPEINK